MSKDKNESEMQTTNKEELEFDVDSILEKLLKVRGKKPGKLVNLAEEEILWLCRTS